MIIRVWTALASDEDQHKYFEHFQSEVLPVLQGLAGYDGATLSSRRSEEGIELLVITRWRSLEDLRAFAGPDIEQAVVADEAARILRTWARRVKHYDVILADGGA